MAVPKLRFKEFDNQWDKTTINDQAKTVTSGSRDWAQYYSESGDKFIRMTNLVRDGIYLDLSDLKFVQLPKDSNEGKRTSLKFGDILISITAELGKLGWISEGLGTAYINQHTALVRMKDSVDSKFVAYSLSTEKYNNKLNSLNDSGAKAGLNLGTIRNFELIVPPKEEQTKIASFLSAMDEKISQLTQKHALLSQYKQGMMQKLFSQQIRFKADDGSEFGEWDEKILSELFDYANGKSFEAEVIENGSFKLITLNSIDIKGNLKNSHKTISQGDNSLLRNDLIMILSDVAHGNFLGLTAIIPDNSFVLNQRVGRLRSKTDINICYMRFYINFNQKYFKLNGQGSSQLNLSKGDVLSFPVNLPCLEEQTKIANFLSSIDQKIEVVAQQIEQAKQWKKGLLQQMFV